MFLPKDLTPKDITYENIEKIRREAKFFEEEKRVLDEVRDAEILAASRREAMRSLYLAAKLQRIRELERAVIKQ